MKKNDRIGHILFLLVISVFSSVYFFQVSSLTLRDEKEVVYVIFSLLIIFVGIQIYHLIFLDPSDKNNIHTDDKAPVRRWFAQSIENKGIILLAFTVAYIPCMVFLGTFISSFSYMAAMSYALGSKDIKKTIVFSLVVVSIFYLFFVTFLSLKFPEGILF